MPQSFFVTTSSVTTEFAAWLVDLDGTLYRATPLKLAMALELALFGLPQLRTLRRFRREHEFALEAAESHESPFAAQLERTARALGASRAEVESVVDHWMFERPAKWIGLFRRRELLAEITAFQAAGGKVALVSDYPVRNKIEGLGLRFDTVVCSGDSGGPRRLKPDPEGYLEAARRIEVPPARCLVIGDRLDRDGEAAARAGMAFRHVR
jgi:HAD superfamily hydrolase (TIGR01549 family)